VKGDGCREKDAAPQFGLFNFFMEVQEEAS